MSNAKFGEPWSFGEGEDGREMQREDSFPITWDTRLEERTITCVNAFEGIDDPEAELARLRKIEEAERKPIELAKPHFREALELLTEAIEEEDFQPCFDRENFMIGPSLLGTLTRAYDALLEVRDALGLSEDIAETVTEGEG